MVIPGDRIADICRLSIEARIELRKKAESGDERALLDWIVAANFAAFQREGLSVEESMEGVRAIMARVEFQVTVK